MSFDLPSLSDAAAQVSPFQDVSGLSSTGTIRGSLTVGTTTAPFSNTTTACCAVSDGAPHGGLDFGTVSPSRVIVGYPNGPGISSLPGVVFPAMDLITVDGVTFGTTAIQPSFFSLTYVPEPTSTALLAVAAASLLVFRARRDAPRPP